jgi:three-Cys-motif partner protein
MPFACIKEYLKSEFPNRAIDILNEDANAAVQRICRDTDWRSNRAVLFLDPYGMQVAWETLAAVAATKAPSRACEPAQ